MNTKIRNKKKINKIILEEVLKLLDNNQLFGEGFDFNYPAKKIFKKIANKWRRKNCGGKSRDLFDGEFHYGCHNFTGPGTRINLSEVQNYPSFNNIDNCSRIHDLDYYNAMKVKDNKLRQQLIREADERAIECYDQFPNENGYYAAKLGIGTKMKFEDFFPILMESLTGQYYGNK